MEKTKKLAVGILAHVDAGKTTLAEGILYKTGQIRKAGRVDHKDAVSEERYRITDPDLHRRLFLHLSLCTDAADARAFCDSGVRRWMLPGIDSVAVTVVLFEDHSG